MGLRSLGGTPAGRYFIFVLISFREGGGSCTLDPLP